jgi:sortase A
VEVREDLIEQAKRHNQSLPPGPFRDPYAVTDSTDPAAVASAMSAYNSLLAGDPAGVMASIQIPSIGVNLPIYHGVDSDTLERGVGHMPQTSLPVGGSGTHAVLVAHTGVANAPLFSNLDKVKLGDTFSIQVMGELLYYQVDQILVVLPDDLDALQLVPGQDYVTLVTCTPKWVNSHRLLVRGTRIDPPASATALASDMGSPRFTALPAIAGPGFPWWSVVILGGAVIAVVVCRVVLTPVKRRRKARTDPAADPVTDPRPDPGVNPEPGRATA